MAENYTRYTGWYVWFPRFLRVEPKLPQDLVSHADFLGFGLNCLDLYPTQDEAWRVARNLLTEARNQALKDIDFLSKPVLSPDGKTAYIVPQDKLAEWQAQAREDLRIADKGLSLCPAE